MITTSEGLRLHEVATMAARRGGELRSKLHFREGDNASLMVDAMEAAEDAAHQIARIEGWDRAARSAYVKVLVAVQLSADRTHGDLPCSVCADMLVASA